MTDRKPRVSLDDVRRLHPDEWVVFAEPRFDTGNTLFIDGILFFHSKDRESALLKSAEIDGDAMIDFTGTRHYERLEPSTDAKSDTTDKAA